jgi:hypothetical protein
MGRYRGLPPEALEILGLEPEGEEDEPDEPSGPYELPHRIAEISAPEGVAGLVENRPRNASSRASRPEADDAEQPRT